MSNTTTTRPSVRRLFVFGAKGAGVAAVINLAIFATGRAAGVDFLVAEPGTEHAHLLGFDIVFLTVVSFAVGILAAAAAIGLRRPSLRVMQILGGTIAVVSCWSDAVIPATAAAKVLLMVTHLVVGTVYVLTLEKVRAGVRSTAGIDTATQYAVAA
jgi:hypothetical protein